MLSSFRWILQGQLAGSGRPGLLDSVESDISWLRLQGFDYLVDLTEEPPPDYGPGLRVRHFPIEDMHVPTPRQALEISQSVLGAIDAGSRVIMHCRAGLGRTGLAAACCLITLGRPAQDALRAIRRVHPRYIQTTTQERFLDHFAEYLRTTRAAHAEGETWRAALERHCERLRADPDLGPGSGGSARDTTAHEAALLARGLGWTDSEGVFQVDEVRRWSSDVARQRHVALLNQTLNELGQPPLSDQRWRAIEQAAQL